MAITWTPYLHGRSRGRWGRRGRILPHSRVRAHHRESPHLCDQWRSHTQTTEDQWRNYMV